MAHKYLLYIHDERFADESEKSKLINKLLDGHYRIKENLVTMNEALTKAPVPTKDRVMMDETGQLHGTDMQFCKHNSVKGFCKKGCK